MLHLVFSSLQERCKLQLDSMYYTCLFTLNILVIGTGASQANDSLGLLAALRR
jgi:hypothetical protein